MKIVLLYGEAGYEKDNRLEPTKRISMDFLIKQEDF